MANFMIEFKALAIKANTNKLHTIFLLKKNVQADINQDYIRISTYNSTRNVKGIKGGNHLSWSRI